MPSSQDRLDPVAAFNFTVEIGDDIKAGFSECSGLSTESDVIEYRTGDDKDAVVAKLPGLVKFTNIVLKRGFIKDKTTLWNWRQEVIDGKTTRKQGTVTLLAEDRSPMLKWRFFEAWPNKLEGPSLNAKNSEVAIETLEIVVEKIEFVEA